MKKTKKTQKKEVQKEFEARNNAQKAAMQVLVEANILAEAARTMLVFPEVTEEEFVNVARSCWFRAKAEVNVRMGAFKAIAEKE